MQLAVPIHDETLIKPFINRGAEFFIIGVKDYAQRMTKTFDIDDTKQLVQTIKKEQKKVWINLNALLHEPDIDGAFKILKALKPLPIDGILFADLAIVNMAEKLAMKDLLIYYPETYTTNAYDTMFWATEKIQSLVVGREMTLEDIKAMHDTLALPLIIVGHGYLNMFHSRRPLVENFFKHTNDQNPALVKDNKNLTLIEEKRNETYPIYQDAFGTHIFRAKPIASFFVIETLKNYLDVMIIDGLLLSDRYHLKAVEDYRDILEGKTIDLSDYETTTDTGFYFKHTGSKKGGMSHD